RQVVHRAGLKMPKGMDWARNPKKYAYNKVYRKTSFYIFKLLKSCPNSRPIVTITTTGLPLRTSNYSFKRQLGTKSRLIHGGVFASWIFSRFAPTICG